MDNMCEISLKLMLEISGCLLPVSNKKKFRQSKFMEIVATVATSHFSFHYYHLPKEKAGEKKEVFLLVKNVSTFNVLL